MNIVTMNKVLNNWSSWFEKRSLDVFTWDSCDLTVNSTTWVHLRGVPLQLWHSQCFAFLKNELGRLSQISHASRSVVEISNHRHNSGSSRNGSLIPDGKIGSQNFDGLVRERPVLGFRGEQMRQRFGALQVLQEKGFSQL